MNLQRGGLLFLICFALRVIEPNAAAAEGPKAPCSGPEYRQFDYWVGDWDAYDVDEPAKVAARNRVDKILNGCVLLEDYQGTNGTKGQSFTIYDAPRRVWHQTWVTNSGKLLVMEGVMKNGELTLSGVDHTADGKQKLFRGIWKTANGSVRETATTSEDGGKTWQPWFDMWFRPHKK